MRHHPESQKGWQTMTAEEVLVDHRKWIHIRRSQGKGFEKKNIKSHEIQEEKKKKEEDVAYPDSHSLSGARQHGDWDTLG